jgi:drug/metabolite transporter superfamily protein YnfA
MDLRANPVELVQLPEEIVLQIFSLLPAVQQAYAARRVCKAAHA